MKTLEEVKRKFNNGSCDYTDLFKYYRLDGPSHNDKELKNMVFSLFDKVYTTYKRVSFAHRADVYSTFNGHTMENVMVFIREEPDEAIHQSLLSASRTAPAVQSSRCSQLYLWDKASNYRIVLIKNTYYEVYMIDGDIYICAYK